MSSLAVCLSRNTPYLVALVILVTTTYAAPQWRPIDKDELAETHSQIEPDAGAEILLRESIVDYPVLDDHANEEHYFKVKIYSERGVRDFSLIKIPYDSTTRISGVAARTIKPDGSIIELKSEDIHDREVRRDEDSSTRTKSFAPPGLEPGAVVEYRYSKNVDVKYVVKLIFSSRWPARRVTYRLKMPPIPPNTTQPVRLRAISVNCPNQKFTPDAGGFYHLEMANVLPVKEEPFQPPAVTTHAAIVVFFSVATHGTPEQFWSSYSESLHKRLESIAKVTKPISAAVVNIVSQTDSEEEKARKIYDFCRTKIVNRSRDTTRLSREERKKLKKNDDATDTLKAGSGSSSEINVLFAALARAAGLDARLAACNDRTVAFFNPQITEPGFMLTQRVVAIRLGGEWRYFDPGASYLPFATLAPPNSDTSILIGDPRGSAPTVIPGAPAELNVSERKATFELRADGTLDGDVTETYTGLSGARLKYLLDDKTPDKQAGLIRKRISYHQRLAKVSSIVVENAADPLAPLKISYHLLIPNYGDRTGTRLFVQPAVLQKGTPSIFGSAQRQTPIIFPFRSTERDEIRLKPPAGFTLEAGSSPGNFAVDGLLDYQTVIQLGKKTGEIIYRRTFIHTDIAFSSAAYPQIKAAFDDVHRRDNHTLALKGDGSITTSETRPAEPQPGPGEPADEDDV